MRRWWRRRRERRAVEQAQARRRGVEAAEREFAAERRTLVEFNDGRPGGYVTATLLIGTDLADDLMRVARREGAEPSELLMRWIADGLTRDLRLRVHYRDALLGVLCRESRWKARTWDTGDVTCRRCLHCLAEAADRR